MNTYTRLSQIAHKSVSLSALPCSTVSQVYHCISVVSLYLDHHWCITINDYIVALKYQCINVVSMYHMGVVVSVLYHLYIIVSTFLALCPMSMLLSVPM